MHLSVSLALAGVLALPVSAFWRLPCVSPLVQERADPIINPGAVSGHLHTIMGGNGFDFTMNYESTQASTCSSCTVKGDFSNYWTPVLFYQHQNGSFEKVNQVGGATVYYLQRNAAGENITAFPKGFQMVAGDPFKRASGNDAASQAISYNCLNYNGPAEPETGGFPAHNCPNGIRSQVFFPSCWDGKNLDSSDHKSHVAYPDGAYNAGTCPSSHPVRLISIFYEIIWDTNAFASNWYGSSQPFVWSMGDPTGYGFHGDFINGWDVALLQRAVNTCTNLSGRVEDCPVFQLTPDSTSQGCKVPEKVNEPVTGLLDALPGCNPVQQGSARASVASNCASSIPKTIQSVTSSIYFTDLTSQGWAYTGCATDNYFSRSLTLASTTSDTMTNEACVAFCQAKGYTYAGTEYSRECYCGNDFPTDRLPVPGIVGNCNMACSGNNTEWCGGSGLMSLYKKCSSTGSGCANTQIGVGSSSVSSNVAAKVVSNTGVTTSTTKTATIPTTATTTITTGPSPTATSKITSTSKTRTRTRTKPKTTQTAKQQWTRDEEQPETAEQPVLDHIVVKKQHWKRHAVKHVLDHTYHHGH